MPEDLSIEYAEKMNECIDVLMGAQDTVVDATQAVAEARREIDEAKNQIMEAPKIATEAMAQAEAANSAAIAAQATADEAKAAADAAKAKAETNATTIASVKTTADAASAKASANETAIAAVKQTADAAATQTALNAVKATADAAATKTEVAAIKTTADAALSKTSAASTYATKTETAAIKTTADAAATKTELDAVKQTADGALPKSGGEMTSELSIKYNNPNLYFINTQFAKQGERVDKRLYGTHVFLASADRGLTAFIQGGIDANNMTFGGLAVRQNKAESPKQASLWAYALDDGTTYATASHPRAENYSTDIVTMKALKDYAAEKLVSDTRIHVGGAGASDTADLFAERGFLESKPFASLTAALFWVAKNCSCAGPITFVLHADVTVPAYALYAPSIAIINLTSDSTKRTIICNGVINLQGGTMQFSNINFQSGPGLNYFAQADGMKGAASLVFKDNVSMNGTVSIAFLRAVNGGSVFVNNDITGSVTGKKYSCTNGGMILGASKIPGTEAGTCDANSKAFG